MEQLLLKSKCSILHSIPEYMTFRKCQGADAPLSLVFPYTFEDAVGMERLLLGSSASGPFSAIFQNT